MWKAIGWFSAGVGILIGVGSNVLTIWQILLLGLPSPIWTAIAFALFSAGLITLVLGFRKEIQDENVETISSNSNNRGLSLGKNQTQKIEDNSVSTSSKERIFVDVAPDYLSNYFVVHTQIQAAKLLDVYIGKWMKIYGTIADIRQLSNSYQVSFSRSHEIKTIIIMYFNKEWVDRLSVLKLGDELGVLGQIEKADRLSLSLNNCELIRQ